MTIAERLEIYDHRSHCPTCQAVVTVFGYAPKHDDLVCRACEPHPRKRGAVTGRARPRIR